MPYFQKVHDVIKMNALKPFLDPKSIALFKVVSTENSEEKGGRLILFVDIKILFFKM